MSAMAQSHTMSTVGLLSMNPGVQKMRTVIIPQGIADARPSPLNLLPFLIFLLSSIIALMKESAKPATPVNTLKNDI